MPVWKRYASVVALVVGVHAVASSSAGSVAGTLGAALLGLFVMWVTE